MKSERVDEIMDNILEAESIEMIRKALEAFPEEDYKDDLCPCGSGLKYEGCCGK